MNRGSIYAFETLLIFLAWMMILTLAWNQTENKTQEMVSLWNMQRMEEKALAQSDALLVKHHINPWNGCAHFDESLRRGKPYIIEKSCLEKLSTSEPSNQIVEISIQQNGKQTIFFQKESEGHDCAVIGRPAIMVPGNHIIRLDVKACEE